MTRTYTDKERQLALKRAQKFTRLFNGKTFDDIMNAVEANPPDKAAFTTACQSANIVQSEIDWLWEYLRHSNKNLWTPVPEAAAGTGW